ncbi:hypothetical protein LshimejAT787_0700330 [Lyophyllum shimeji]|uniref:Uncharacterized protein n=1 Tax=Lyophyllum shimeji TaxID=47721 RepID=A0A9P3PP73_LYOSH|nr:hypothetical protein LshimejAT787_0700330 [Lyophyllum shimeji]
MKVPRAHFISVAPGLPRHTALVQNFALPTKERATTGLILKAVTNIYNEDPTFRGTILPRCVIKFDKYALGTSRPPRST